MRKEFIGLSDDGYRMYTMWTPGEKGDCGIVMTIGYRGDEFMVYDSEAWNDDKEQAFERSIESEADGRRDMRKYMQSLAGMATGMLVVGAPRTLGKSNLGYQQVQMMNGSFDELEAKAQKRMVDSLSFLDEYASSIKPKPTPDKQSQPNRKPQPNRGPMGRKDWKK